VILGYYIGIKIDRRVRKVAAHLTGIAVSQSAHAAAIPAYRSTIKCLDQGSLARLEFTAVKYALISSYIREFCV